MSKHRSPQRGPKHRLKRQEKDNGKDRQAITCIGDGGSGGVI